MALTTVNDVKKIIDTSLDDAIIESYIEAASTLTCELVGSSAELSTATKKEIERWLTAHMIAGTRERIGKEEGAGDAYIKYQGVFEGGLKSTSYGQMVITLDTTGAFAAQGGGKLKANITVL